MLFFYELVTCGQSPDKKMDAPGKLKTNVKLAAACEPSTHENLWLLISVP